MQYWCTQFNLFSLPSTDPSQRSLHIAQFALQSRRQVIKLLVILRWSREVNGGSSKIIVARGLNEFLWRQNFIFQGVIEGLRDVNLGFSNAKVRNSDIITALDVLQTGSYHGLPTGLTKAFKPQPPLRATAIISHLEKMNDVIRYRLRTKEIIPNSMKQIPYTVADGRVFFYVKNLFTCSLTLSGRSNDDIWFLLSIEFSLGANNKEEYYTQSPKYAIRDDILALSNEELSAKSPQNSSLGDAPLVRLCNFLIDLSLNYKIEILYTQATKLAFKSWKNQIDISMSKDRKSFSIGYWLRSKSTVKTEPGQSKPIVQTNQVESGRLTISIVTLPSEKQNPIESIMNKIEIKSKLKNASLSDKIIDRRIQVDWQREDKSDIGDVKLDINEGSLSIERILLQALSLHSCTLLKKYQTSLCSTSTWFTPSNVFLQIPETLGIGISPTLHIQLYETEMLIISISPTTGRLIVRDPNESGTSAPARLRPFVERINEIGGSVDNTMILIEIINRLRQTVSLNIKRLL